MQAPALQSTLQQARVYTDLAGLEQLKHQARDNGKAALEEVAQQFEGIFLSTVLKSMRQANEAFATDSYFNSNQSKMYRDMLDQQLSVSLTQGEGIGLARSLIQQLEKYLPAERGAATAPVNGYSLPATKRSAGLDLRV